MSKDKAREIGEGLGYMLILLLVVMPIGALEIMLACGALHSYFPQVPAFGWWESLAVMAGLGAVRGMWRVKPS